MKKFYLKKKIEMVSAWKKKGRPRNLWMQEVKTGLREKGIDNMEWVDKKEW